MKSWGLSYQSTALLPLAIAITPPDRGTTTTTATAAQTEADTMTTDASTWDDDDAMEATVTSTSEPLSTGFSSAHLRSSGVIHLLTSSLTSLGTSSLTSLGTSLGTSFANRWGSARLLFQQLPLGAELTQQLALSLSVTASVQCGDREGAEEEEEMLRLITGLTGKVEKYGFRNMSAMLKLRQRSSAHHKDLSRSVAVCVCADWCASLSLFFYFSCRFLSLRSSSCNCICILV